MHKKLPNLLRSQTNEIEKTFWGLLRDRRFQGYKFRRQVQIGKYVVDFLCYKKRLIIELDGSQHNEDAHQVCDQERTLWLEQQGFRVIRFWNHEVMNQKEAVLERVFNELLI